MGHIYLYHPPFLIDRLYINSGVFDICPWYYIPSYLKTQYSLYTKQCFSVCSKLRKSWADHYRMRHIYLYHPPFLIDRLYINSLAGYMSMVLHAIIPQDTPLILYTKQWFSICSKLRKSWAGHYRMDHLYLYHPPFLIDRLYINSLVLKTCPWYHMPLYLKTHYLSCIQSNDSVFVVNYENHEPVIIEMSHLHLCHPSFLIDRLYINSLVLNTCPWYYMPSYLKTQY